MRLVSGFSNILAAEYPHPELGSADTKAKKLFAVDTNQTARGGMSLNSISTFSKGPSK